MWAIVIVTTVAFMFFGIWGPSVSGRTVARVNGQVITAEELNRVYENMINYYRDQMKVKMDDNFRKALKNQALREIITNRLMVMEAKRVGLRVSDGELQAYIMSIPAFMIGGRFDQRAYQRMLININMKPAVFEANQRNTLLQQKLEHLVEDGIATSDSEVQSAFASKNPKVKLSDRKKQEEAFKETYLREKQRAALSAFVKNLSNKAEIKITDKELAS
jgi:peptidyl-prolyl cis-trans isomerase D